ncbi:hypothetical protein, conserved [Leishmania tarentolae]|uniref:Uncharacterized protein n=1 Tax=Leishmania tarentolae TaxID=5689 RepID=A0A640KUS9_LEITA|nr:hypothetical protein, conserved [Leishmania tarentolae]
MPPAANTPARDKEHLHRMFSAAANALADLYRESSNSYEAGYRDALLFVQRYLQSSSAVTHSGHSPSSAFTTCETVNAQHMAQFLQNTIATRRERMAVVRGIHSLRRRERESEQGNNGVGDVGTSGDDGDATENDEDDAREESCLTPQPSPVVARESSTCFTALTASDLVRTPTTPFSSGAPVMVNSTSSLLSREMEHVIHTEYPVPARLPYQPRRQCPRMEHAHGHRSLGIADGQAVPTQLRVARRS